MRNPLMIIPLFLGIVLLITSIWVYKQIEKTREGVTSVKLFRARLIDISHNYKPMEWFAVPVDNQNDTVLIDFGLGEFPEITSGDTVSVVGEQQPSSQWLYWYELHWLDQRKLLLRAS